MVAGLILQIELLVTFTATLLFGSFFVLMFTGCDGEYPEPRGHVDWRE